MAEMKRLTADDLTTFDDDMTNLVLRMGEHGWTGRISTRGHAIMHAPDGVTTESVSRSGTRSRSGANAKSDFERWLKRSAHPSSHSRRPTLTLVESPSSPDPERPYPCPDGCGLYFATRQGAASHKKAHAPWVTCPVCKMPTRGMGQHRRRRHPHLTGMDFEALGLAAQPIEEALAESPSTLVISEPETPSDRPETAPLPEPTPPSGASHLDAMEALLAVLAEVDALRAENAQLRKRLAERETNGG